ncbi:MAG: hypothetical protein Kapaf2KO_08420 [Candidatus Kapaibacteriales bacterium]
MLSTLSSCIVVKEKAPTKYEAKPSEWAESSDIGVAGEIVASKSGDIAINIGSGWTPLNSFGENKNLIFSGKNEEETLILALSVHGNSDIEIEKGESVSPKVLGLAMEKVKQTLSGKGKATIVGDPQVFKVQDQNHLLYKVSTTSGATSTFGMITIAKTGNIYNLLIIPVPDIVKRVPGEEEIEKMVKDITKTVLI